MFSNQKQHLRLAVRERFIHLPNQERVTEGRSISKRVLEALPKEPCTVCAYYPLTNEPNILPGLERLLTQGYALFLPCTTGVQIVYRKVTDLSALQPGPFKVPEPPRDADEVKLEDVQIALVPGAAFDRTGNRLGRGNGGYDRWLSRLRAANPTAEVWGLAFEHQIVEQVPTEPHDQPVDAIVTARKIEHCTRR